MASTEQWQADGKQDIFVYKTTKFFVINGRRNAEWKAAKGFDHPLYDPRADEAEAKPSRKMIKAIKAHRYVQPIPVFRAEWLDGSWVIIPIDGRNRIEAVEAVNTEIAGEIERGERDDSKANGELLIPAKPFTGTIEQARAIMLASGIKRQSNPLRDAEMCAEYQRATGASDEMAAVTMGCTVQKIQMGHRLLECIEEVRHRVRDGELSLNVVIEEKVYAMSPKEQREALTRLDAAGAGRGSRAKAAVRPPGSGSGSNKSTAQPVSRKAYPVVAEQFRRNGLNDLADIVAWLDDRSRPLPPDLAEMLGAVVDENGRIKPAPKAPRTRKAQPEPEEAT